MSALAERIQESRVALGIDPAELARRVGVKPAAAYQWESGATQSLKAETAIALAEVLGVDLVWLVTGRKSKAGTAPPSQSHPLQLDPERIAELVTVLAERWKDVPGGFDLCNETHAAHFVLCYGLYVDMKERPVPENMVAFSAALTSPQGATRDERGKNVPASGTTERKTGAGRGRKD